MIGQIISHYRILEKLGEGGMGVVYKAEDTKLRRSVALKFLPRGLEAHEAERARFLQEAQAAATLNHPNICTIHDIKEEGDQHFIVMEYIDGRTLREMAPVLKIQDALGYAIQIGEALQEAHSHGIVHRDVKTANIMVNAKNQVKVMDFGLAKLKGSLKLTKTSSTVGTLAYMAPEQIKGGEVDARSDIFSFGVVLYELLTGRLPFKGDYEAAVVYSILNEEPVPIQKHRPEVSSELLHILNRALEKEPEERYQSVQEMVIDLKRAKKETSRVSRVSVVVPAGEEGRRLISEEQGATPTAGRKKPPRILLLAGLVVALVSIVAIALLTVLRSHAPRLNPEMTFRTLEVPLTQINYPDISQDGQWVAFPACDANNEWSIYFMNVAKGNPLRLTKGSASETNDADISPDASEVLYDQKSPSGIFGLYVVSSAGGVARKIAEPGGLAKWHPDGNRIGYLRLGRSIIPSQSGRREFWTVNRDGTGNQLEFVDSLSYLYTGMSFDWSPDGNSIVWPKSFPNHKEIFIRDLKSGKERQLTSSLKEIDEVAWASNNQIFFTSNRGGNTNVWIIPASGGDAVQITKGSGPDLCVRVSADGKRLLYLEQRTFTHVWSADIDGSNARQLTFDNQNLNVPEFSPDKTRISFDMGSADLLQSSNHVFIMDSDGSNRTQLTAGDAQYFHAAWSPDGRHMTYASKQVNEPMDSAQIYLIELENPETPRLIGKGIGVRWINEEKLLTVTIPNLGHPHTTLYSIHSREPIEASKDSTREYPLRDGRSVVVADYRKGREGWWIETRGAGQGSAPKQILSSACLLTSFLSANLRYIIYAEASGEVWRISIPEGKRERLPDILNGINPGSGDIQMSHDDKQLVFAREQLDSRLVLIENVFR